jgi:hypothetical protein
MAIEVGNKVIPAYSKFTSELDVSQPEERKEMNSRVYGRGYRTGRDGKPIDQSRGSDGFWTSDAHMPETEKEQQALLHRLRDTFISHINSIREHSAAGHCAMATRGTHIEDADREERRIQEIRRRAGLPALPSPSGQHAPTGFEAI